MDWERCIRKIKHLPCHCTRTVGVGCRLADKKADGAKHNPNAQKELMQSIAKQNEDMARKWRAAIEN